MTRTLQLRSVTVGSLVLCYENLGSGTRTGNCASWRDDARVADCGGKDGENWGIYESLTYFLKEWGPAGWRAYFLNHIRHRRAS